MQDGLPALGGGGTSVGNTINHGKTPFNYTAPMCLSNFIVALTSNIFVQHASFTFFLQVSYHNLD
ncbi:hypothetical protein KDA_37620 [Dictyobacter alpinus]|uniref:Uncharacterized protein n=1 Tax=Dictyobacter alpinus TaxID=2014873 RepID=A0A402BA61_9CHLR|nr:hypothetical protein KDA_37620 [Dictyobacter alpinus]